MAQIIICDICGSKERVKVHCYVYDRATDAAGAMEDIYYQVDLCEACELSVLKQVIKKLTKGSIDQWKLNKIIIETIVQRIREKDKK